VGSIPIARSSLLFMKNKGLMKTTPPKKSVARTSWSQGGPKSPHAGHIPAANERKFGRALFAAVEAIRSGKSPNPIFDRTFVDGHVLDAKFLKHFAVTGEQMEVSETLRTGQQIEWSHASDGNWLPCLDEILKCVDQAIAHLWNPLSQADGAHRWRVKQDNLHKSALALRVGYNARLTELRDLAPLLPPSIVAERQEWLFEEVRKKTTRKLAGNAAELIFEIIRMATPKDVPHDQRHRAKHSGDETMIMLAIDGVIAGKTVAKAVASATEQFRGNAKEAEALRRRINRKVCVRLGQSAGNP
jgi:hypothetical protein